MIDFRNCIETLTPYIPGRPIEDVKREYGLNEVIKLASNENPYGCSPKAKEAAINALNNAAIYPDGNCTALRGAVAKKHNVSENQIVFGCGTDEVISMIGKVFVNEGDECITGSVTFSQYMASVISIGGKMVYADMKNHGFDLDGILAKITDRTKVIFIANPNNPTGTIVSDTEQRNFLKKVPKHILVVLDEAYSEYAGGGEYPDSFNYLKEYKNVMILKTFSKVYGLASLRVGYGVACEEIIDLFEKIRNPFNVPSTAQAAALAALEDAEFLSESISKNEDVKIYAYREFDAMGIEYIPTYTNFIMADMKRDSRALFTELMKRGFIVRPGAAFGMDTFLRVTLGTMDEMKRFFGALKEILK